MPLNKILVPAAGVLVGIVATACLPHRAMSAGISKGPYLQNVTPNGITVCWVSDRETRGEVTVSPGKRSSSPTREATPARYHRVQLSGLRPYTRYRYTVHSDGSEVSGSFRTAARAGQPFTFVAYGDCRTQPDRHAEVLARIRRFRPDLIIQTGDQVADGRNEDQWDEFWRVVSPTLRDFPYYPTMGNHERHGAPYFRYFDLPAEYSFDYGDVHFAAIDSDCPAAERAAQEVWLEQDLAAHQGSRWRVVFFHHTPYTCVTLAGRREAAEKLRARLEPIFLRQRVQLVISGHDHDYQRHVAHGITYVVTGGGGAPLYDVRPDTPYVKAARKAYHDCEFVVRGTTIDARAMQPNGALIDRFSLVSRR